MTAIAPTPTPAALPVLAASGGHDPVQADLAANAYWKPVANRPRTFARKTYGAEAFCATVHASDPSMADSAITAGMIVRLPMKPSQAAWKRAWMRFRQEIWPQVAAKVPTPSVMEVTLAQDAQDLETWADTTLHVHAASEHAVTAADLQALKYQLSGSHDATPFPSPNGYEAEMHVLPSSASSSMGLTLRISHWHSDGPAALTVLRTVTQLVLEDDERPPRCDGSEERLLLPAMPALIREELRPDPKDHDALVVAQVDVGMSNAASNLQLHFSHPYPPSQWGHTIYQELIIPSSTVDSVRAWASQHGVNVSHVIHAAWSLALAASNLAGLSESTVLSNFLAVNVRRTFHEGLQQASQAYHSCTAALMLVVPIGKLAKRAATTLPNDNKGAALLSNPQLLLSVARAVKDSYTSLSTPKRAANGYLVEPFAQRLFAFMAAAGAASGAAEPPLPRTANLVADGKYEHHVPREIKVTNRDGKEATAYIESLMVGVNVGSKRSQFPVSSRWFEYGGEVNLSAEANEAVFDVDELREFLGCWKMALMACCSGRGGEGVREA